jgi:hypothetical protein
MDKDKDRSKVRTRVKHTLRNKGRELANLLIDVVSASSFDCVVALTAPSAFFVCDHRPTRGTTSLKLHEARKSEVNYSLFSSSILCGVRSDILGADTTSAWCAVTAESACS